jgi:alkanesulfonate monooxygenase SsuD/methylene tetrahydromethanopterin reductase-like flavin-dependent oxidoreductase (luciferase family)
MKLGVLLPTFRDNADDALASARRAADAGLDGVFAYDHLWPMGTPTRPSLAPFPVLTAVARANPTLVVGPLVARVGLVGTPHLIEQFTTLHALAPGRVIATLGSGDKLSADENVAYDIPERNADERRTLMAETARALVDAMPVWFGAGNDRTNGVARDVGAVLNLWNAAPQRVLALGATGPVSWAGPVPDDLAGALDALRDAGATWVVLTPDADIDALATWRHDRDE